MVACWVWGGGSAVKISERRHWHRSGVFIVNFEHILHIVLVFLLLTWTCKCQLGCCFCIKINIWKLILSWSFMSFSNQVSQWPDVFWWHLLPLIDVLQDDNCRWPGYSYWQRLLIDNVILLALGSVLPGLQIFASSVEFIRTCTHQGVRIVGFSKNFAYVLNEWSLIIFCFIFADKEGYSLISIHF